MPPISTASSRANYLRGIPGRASKDDSSNSTYLRKRGVEEGDNTRAMRVATTAVQRRKTHVKRGEPSWESGSLSSRSN